MTPQLTIDLSDIDIPRPDTRAWFDAGLFWPEHLLCSEWVESSMVLDPQVTAMPGQVSLAHMHYLREVLDAFSDPYVRDITLEWSTQTGKTFAELCMISYTADQFPLPVLLTLPTETITGEMLSNRLGPMISTTPVLRRHMRGGRRCITKRGIKLDRMTIYGAWAGSPAELASRAIGVAINDEVNKWPMQSGKEASPFDLIGERLRTYKRVSKNVTASTPTVPGGLITTLYEVSDRRTYRVPCPHCGEYQELKWANVHYPKKEEATKERIRDERLAWYCCAHCEEKIGEEHKAGMVKRGVWCPDGADVNKAGELVGDVVKSSHRGYRINALYSPFLTWSDTVHKYLESYRWTLKLMNFTNSWLGEVWEEVVDGVRIDVGENLSESAKLGTPPADTFCLLAGADVQGVEGKNHIWYSVHALRPDEQIQLVEYGKLKADDDQSDFDKLWDEVMCGTWRTEDGRDLDVLELGIDRRWRTHEVDKFARRNRQRITMMMGGKSPDAMPLQQRMIEAKKNQKKTKRLLTYQDINTYYFKSLMADIVHAGHWIIPEEGTEEYCRQFVSEQKCVEKDSNEVIIKKYWGLRRGHRDNHLWDSSDYMTGIAYKRGFFKGIMEIEASKPKGPVHRAKRKSGWQIGRG